MGPDPWAEFLKRSRGAVGGPTPLQMAPHAFVEVQSGSVRRQVLKPETSPVGADELTRLAGAVIGAAIHDQHQPEKARFSGATCLCNSLECGNSDPHKHAPRGRPHLRIHRSGSPTNHGPRGEARPPPREPDVHVSFQSSRRKTNKRPATLRSVVRGNLADGPPSSLPHRGKRRGVY